MPKAKRSAKQVSAKISKDAARVYEIADKTLDNMTVITVRVQTASAKILELAKKSQEINKVVELIEHMTEQTNILALNASIEASKAGEVGKGFSLVASEIRKLAERASDSTKDVRLIVSEIQEVINQVVFSMEGTAKDTVKGARLVEQTALAAKEISAVIAKEKKS
ncbi:MAG: methyl-accepting chemotaxis protein [Candidatus Saganbacteria bacterium]|nr:methyl-accepting chemotaxis protein [Candidatus Saganbacteria bacterium]